MPQQAWNNKRERQYEHVKSSAEEKGSSEGRAEEIAARTVNKNRARTGEADEASTTSTQDISPQRRGGIRSGNRIGPGGRTKDQLYDDARRQGITGRSSMTKKQLEQALDSR
ncbi:MAG: plasmid stabilization protein [Pseudonocardiaceae bacterium]|nr:plasmid stabilization protein [Pseudonocardiaceae bacterium]